MKKIKKIRSTHTETGSSNEEPTPRKKARAKSKNLKVVFQESIISNEVRQKTRNATTMPEEEKIKEEEKAFEESESESEEEELPTGYEVRAEEDDGDGWSETAVRNFGQDLGSAQEYYQTLLIQSDQKPEWRAVVLTLYDENGDGDVFDEWHRE